MPNTILSLPNPFFYTFFFSHRSQTVPTAAVENTEASLSNYNFSWVKLNLYSPYQQRPSERSQTTISLKIAPSQFGNLRFKAKPPARSFLNASFRVLASSSSLKASSVTQPVLFDATIHIANSLPSSYSVSWNYLGSSPNRTAIFPLLSNDENEDSFYELPYQVIKSDLPTSNANNLVVDRIPFGEVDISFVSAGQIYSHPYIPAVGRGFLPNQTLYRESDLEDTNLVLATGCSIHDLGTALMTLVSLDNQGDLIYQTLQELCFLWRLTKSEAARRLQLYNNFGDPVGEVVDAIGLPSFLPAFGDPYNTSGMRVTLDQAWLGLGIIKACEYLRDRLHAQVLPIPDDIPLVLEDLAQAVSRCIDPIRGVVFLGFDEYGRLAEYEDFPSLVVTQIFLADYCSRSYNFSCHLLAARTYSTVNRLLYTSPSLSLLEVQQAKVHLYKLVWLLKYQDRITSQVVLTNLADSLVEILREESIEPAQFSEHMLLSFILNSLGLNSIGIPSTSSAIVNSDYSKWNGFNTVESYAPGLFAYKDAASPIQRPQLHESSWLLLASKAKSWLAAGRLLFQESNFNLQALEANAYYAYSFQTLKKMWPYGSKWTSSKAENLAYNGILASLFAATAEATRSWFISYAMTKDGAFLKSASGSALDKWGDDLLIKRPILQDDKVYRATLIDALNNVGLTAVNLINLAHSRGISIKLREPSNLFTFFYRVELNPFVGTTPSSYTYSHKVWEGTSNDFIKVLNSGESEPGFFYPLNPELGDLSEMYFIKWSSFAPSLEAVINFTSADFYRLFMNSVGAGINARMILQPYIPSSAHIDARGNISASSSS